MEKAFQFIVWVTLLSAFGCTSRADDLTEMCTLLSETASKAMSLRQNGTPMQQLLEIPDKTKAPKAVKDMMIKIYVAAYSEPLWATEEHKESAVTEFGNTILLQCLHDFK